MKHYATIAALLSVASAIPASPAKLAERNYGGNTCACAPPAPTESQAMSSAAMAMSSSAASMMSAYSSMSSVSAMSSFAQSGCPAPSVIYVTSAMSTTASTPMSTPESSASKEMSSAAKDVSSSAAASSSDAASSSAKASSSAAASSAPASSTAAASSSCPSAASSQATSLTNSITNLASKLQDLDTSIKNFKAGDFNGALAIQTASQDAEKALTSADDVAKSTSPLSDCDSQFVSNQVTNLVPTINTVINDLIAAKPKFCKTDAGGLNGQIVNNLQTQQADSTLFSKDVTAKLAPKYASAAPAVTEQIDSDFSKAISSYQASC